jgi:hypothetical protein
MRLASHTDVLRVLRIGAQAQVIDIDTHKDFRRQQRSESVILQPTPDNARVSSSHFYARKRRILQYVRPRFRRSSLMIAFAEIAGASTCGRPSGGESILARL